MTPSFPPQRGEFSSEASGNFARRDLVGGSARPRRFRSRIPPACGRRSRRRAEPQPRATVVCVPLTSNLKWALAPGNVRLSARTTGLPKESVANVSQIIAIDKEFLKARVGKLPLLKLELLLSGIDIVLGR